MTEDNFEEFLKDAAQGYNVPPARTPRDEMWSAIQAQRAAGPRVVYGGGSPVRESPVRRFGSKIWLGAAAAAMLLLATGVGIGRWSASPGNTSPVAVVSPPQIPPSPDSSAPQSTGTAPEEERAVASTAPDAAGAPRASSRGTAVRREVAPQLDANGGNGSRVAVGGSSTNSGSSSAYRITAVRHLSEAEALLTSFRTRTTTDQQMDAQLASWARDLLSKTRLLLDSPVASDPQRRPLLEDLELVLVQIVQLSPGSTRQDRELIEKTLQQDNVMTRLRTAIPAGPQRGS
jgi:hypothetical protein